MGMTTFAVSFVLLFLLLFCGGAIALQIFLSKRESKWPGLVMPVISFIFATLVALSIVLFTAQTATSGYYTETGEFIVQSVRQMVDPSSIIASAVYVFLIYNIPTAVLAAIYAACRSKRNKQRELEKMSVQDL